MAEYGLQNRVYSVNVKIRDVRVNQETLDNIYENAKLGLSLKAIAYRSGMTLPELNQVLQLDPRASEALAGGQSDQECELSAIMMDAARNGDSRAALEILRAKHGWIAASVVKSEISGPGGGPVQLSAVDFRGLSNTEIETMTKLMEKAVNELPATTGEV